jgi:hypothetical protein
MYSYPEVMEVRTSTLYFEMRIHTIQAHDSPFLSAVCYNTNRMNSYFFIKKKDRILLNFVFLDWKKEAFTKHSF